MSVTQIDEYTVTYSSNTFFPRIGLKHAGAFIGQLVFHPNGTALPADGLLSGQPQLHYHLDDFQNAIDLLRNEKPMFLLFVGSGGGNENAIRSTAEPVGEGEA